MKSAILGIAAAIAITSAAMAQSDSKFDLICKGVVVAENTGANDFDPAPFEKGPIPYMTHLQVDLDGKIFCQDNCQSPEAIVAIDPEAMLFRNDQGAFNHSRFLTKRGDGSFVYSWTEPGDRASRRAFLTKTASGQCTKMPFTPLPKNAF